MIAGVASVTTRTSTSWKRTASMSCPALAEPIHVFADMTVRSRLAFGEEVARKAGAATVAATASATTTGSSIRHRRSTRVATASSPRPTTTNGPAVWSTTTRYAVESYQRNAPTATSTSSRTPMTTSSQSRRPRRPGNSCRPPREEPGASPCAARAARCASARAVPPSTSCTVTSGLQHDRDDHRAAADLAPDPGADRAADDLLELLVVADPLGDGLLDGPLDLGDDLLEDLVVLDEPAGRDLRAARDLAGGRVEHDDAGDETLVAQDPPVLEQPLVGAPHRAAVAEAVAALDETDDRRLTTDEVDDDAVLGKHDVVLVDPGGDGDLGVGVHVPPLAVDREHVARLDDVVAVEQLAGAGVAGDVHLGVALVHDRGAEAHQAVDDPVDGVLVARDEAAREQHRVTGADVDAVLAVRHPREGRHRLTLGAGADEDELVVAQAVDLLDVDEDAVRHPEVAELGRDAHVAHHRAADHGHLAARLLGRVEHLLDAVHVAAEAGDDDASLGMAEDLVDGGRDLELGRRETGDVGVGRVGEEEVDALLPEPGEGAQVGQATVQGQLVHLEVAGVQQRAGLGAHEDGERVGDRVVDGDELEVEDAELLALPLLDGHGVRPDAVLLELGLHEREGQRGADDRDVALELEQVGHRADVVLVAVREDDRHDVVEPVGDVAEVREDQVDSRVVVLGEEDAAVDDEQLAPGLEHGHVAADLAEPTERHDPQAVVGEGGGRGQLWVRVAHRCPVIRWCCLAFEGSGQRSCGGHPAAESAVRRSDVCASSASTSGRRTVGDSMTPWRTRPALAMIAPWVTFMTASTSGASRRWTARASSQRPSRTASAISR